MGPGIAGGLAQLVDDVLGRGHVGVAHAEVDHVHALATQLGLDAVDLFENVRRQALDTMEVVVHDEKCLAGRSLGAWIDSGRVGAKRMRELLFRPRGPSAGAPCASGAG